MRLIDADKIKIKPEYMHDICGSAMIRVEDVARIINDIPTIPQQEWIPCSERLPEEGTEVLGTDDRGCIRHVVKDKSALYEFATYEEMMHINIVAWQPLPEPYKEV